MEQDGGFLCCFRGLAKSRPPDHDDENSNLQPPQGKSDDVETTVSTNDSENVSTKATDKEFEPVQEVKTPSKLKRIPENNTMPTSTSGAVSGPAQRGRKTSSVTSSNTRPAWKPTGHNVYSSQRDPYSSPNFITNRPMRHADLHRSTPNFLGDDGETRVSTTSQESYQAWPLQDSKSTNKSQSCPAIDQLQVFDENASRGIRGSRGSSPSTGAPYAVDDGSFGQKRHDLAVYRPGLKLRAEINTPRMSNPLGRDDAANDSSTSRPPAVDESVTQGMDRRAGLMTRSSHRPTDPSSLSHESPYAVDPTNMEIYHRPAPAAYQPGMDLRHCISPTFSDKPFATGPQESYHSSNFPVAYQPGMQVRADIKNQDSYSSLGYDTGYSTSEQTFSPRSIASTEALPEFTLETGESDFSQEHTRSHSPGTSARSPSPHKTGHFTPSDASANSSDPSRSIVKGDSSIGRGRDAAESTVDSTENRHLPSEPCMETTDGNPCRQKTPLSPAVAVDGYMSDDSIDNSPRRKRKDQDSSTTDPLKDLFKKPADGYHSDAGSDMSMDSIDSADLLDSRPRVDCSKSIPDSLENSPASPQKHVSFDVEWQPAKQLAPPNRKSQRDSGESKAKIPKKNFIPELGMTSPTFGRKRLDPPLKPKFLKTQEDYPSNESLVFGHPLEDDGRDTYLEKKPKTSQRAQSMDCLAPKRGLNDGKRSTSHDNLSRNREVSGDGRKENRQPLPKRSPVERKIAAKTDALPTRKPNTNVGSRIDSGLNESNRARSRSPDPKKTIMDQPRARPNTKVGSRIDSGSRLQSKSPEPKKIEINKPMNIRKPISKIDTGCGDRTKWPKNAPKAPVSTGPRFPYKPPQGRYTKQIQPGKPLRTTPARMSASCTDLRASPVRLKASSKLSSSLSDISCQTDNRRYSDIGIQTDEESIASSCEFLDRAVGTSDPFWDGPKRNELSPKRTAGKPHKRISDKKADTWGESEVKTNDEHYNEPYEIHNSQKHNKGEPIEVDFFTQAETTANKSSSNRDLLAEFDVLRPSPSKEASLSDPMHSNSHKNESTFDLNAWPDDIRSKPKAVDTAKHSESLDQAFMSPEPGQVDFVDFSKPNNEGSWFSEEPHRDEFIPEDEHPHETAHNKAWLRSQAAKRDAFKPNDNNVMIIDSASNNETSQTYQYSQQQQQQQQQHRDFNKHKENTTSMEDFKPYAKPKDPTSGYTSPRVESPKVQRPRKVEFLVSVKDEQDISSPSSHSSSSESPEFSNPDRMSRKIVKHNHSRPYEPQPTGPRTFDLPDEIFDKYAQRPFSPTSSRSESPINEFFCKSNTDKKRPEIREQLRKLDSSRTECAPGHYVSEPHRSDSRNSPLVARVLPNYTKDGDKGALADIEISIDFDEEKKEDAEAKRMREIVTVDSDCKTVTTENVPHIDVSLAHLGDTPKPSSASGTSMDEYDPSYDDVPEIHQTYGVQISSSDSEEESNAHRYVTRTPAKDYRSSDVHQPSYKKEPERYSNNDSYQPVNADSRKVEYSSPHTRDSRRVEYSTSYDGNVAHAGEPLDRSTPKDMIIVSRRSSTSSDTITENETEFGQQDIDYEPLEPVKPVEQLQMYEPDVVMRRTDRLYESRHPDVVSHPVPVDSSEKPTVSVRDRLHQMTNKPQESRRSYTPVQDVQDAPANNVKNIKSMFEQKPTEQSRGKQRDISPVTSPFIINRRPPNPDTSDSENERRNGNKPTDTMRNVNGEQKKRRKERRKQGRNNRDPEYTLDKYEPHSHTSTANIDVSRNGDKKFVPLEFQFDVKPMVIIDKDNQNAAHREIEIAPQNVQWTHSKPAENSLQYKLHFSPMNENLVISDTEDISDVGSSDLDETHHDVVSLHSDSSPNAYYTGVPKPTMYYLEQNGDPTAFTRIYRHPGEMDSSLVSSDSSTSPANSLRRLWTGVGKYAPSGAKTERNFSQQQTTDVQIMPQNAEPKAQKVVRQMERSEPRNIVGEDYNELKGPQVFVAGSAGENACTTCGQRVYEMEKLVADKQLYHKTCFKCSKCKRTLGVGNYAMNEGKLLCKPHFMELFRLRDGVRPDEGEDGEGKIVRAEDKQEDDRENLPSLKNIKSRFENVEENRVQQDRPAPGKLKRVWSADTARNKEVSPSPPRDPEIVREQKAKDEITITSGGIINIKKQYMDSVARPAAGSGPPPPMDIPREEFNRSEPSPSPARDPNVVRSDDIMDEGQCMPAPQTTRGLVARFKQMEVDHQGQSSQPAPDQRLDLLEQERQIPDSGVFENNPNYRDDVTTEYDVEDEKELPEVGAAKSRINMFRQIEKENVVKPPPNFGESYEGSTGAKPMVNGGDPRQQQYTDIQYGNQQDDLQVSQHQIRLN